MMLTNNPADIRLSGGREVWHVRELMCVAAQVQMKSPAG